MIYVVENLSKARADLSKVSESICLTNSATSVVFYGVMVIDHIFSTLRSEFAQVNEVIINVGDSRVALINAVKLGYKQIQYDNINYNITSDRVDINGFVFNIKIDYEYL